MIGFPEVILLTAMILLPLGCIANWIVCWKRMQAGEPLVPFETRDNVSWGLVDLGVIIVILAVVAGAGVSLVTSAMGIKDASSIEAMTPHNQATIFLAFGTATLLATALCFLWIWLRYGQIDGFGAYRLGSDIELGIRWFMMLIVPVVLLQLILTRWFPTKHPLIEMLRGSKDLSFLPVAAYAAVVAAPIFEEAFFRLFLQGWLEKLQITMLRVRMGLGTKADNEAVIVGGPSPARLNHIEDFGTTAAPPATDAHVDANPYATPAMTPLPQVGKPPEEQRVIWIPILVTSVFFALAHLGHGPDWVPLFFLALGLGYLYQRTGRIQSCIVVHVLVNALGVLQLWSAVRQP